MRKLTPILLGTLLFVSINSPLLEVQALLPTFLHYSISNTAPDITQPVTISVELDFVTDEGEDISSMVGSLSVLLHWSRDKVSWASDSMSLIASYNYRSDIPRQDGYTNSKYDFGSGPCYWYIEIKNNLGESDTKYSISEPNNEIYYLDYSIGETVVIGDDVSPAPSDLGQVFNQILTEAFGSNPLDDPFVQIILVVMIAIIVLIIATQGGGQRAQNILSKLFRFGKR